MKMKGWVVLPLICLFLISGCNKETTNVLSVDNNAGVLQLPVPAEQEAGKPCSVAGDCGIDGCIQQNQGSSAICNGRRYACTIGKCEVEDNLFKGYYCTEFGCQELCGNNACETKYKENDKNCPADCLGKGLIFEY